MRRFLAVFIGFALVGCVAESNPVVSPDVDEANAPSSEQASTEGTESKNPFAVDVTRIGSTQQGLSNGKESGSTQKPPPLPYRADEPPPPTPNPGDGR
jgi:hypothetical protein